MRCIPFLLLMLLIVGSAGAQDNSLLTLFEKSEGKQTPRYKETIAWCNQLDKASAQVSYKVFGKSPQGRDLPLLIVDKQGYSTPLEIKKTGRLVLMIQACIHAGEPDGKDAGLMLMRDLTLNKKYPGLLNHVSIIFIPVFNVDGHERFGPFNRINQNGPEEMGWRTTAQNLNLNRDYLKADAPEMQCWLKLFNQWLPDFFVDCHVTDGADYQYVLTYALEPHSGVQSEQADWVRNTFEPDMVKTMDQEGFPVFPYVEFRRWHDPRSGISNGVAPPMLSQGYVSARNRIGLLIESHMLKPYKQRVQGTYALLKYVLESMNRHYAEIGRLNRETDKLVSGPLFRNQPYPLSYNESDSDSIMVNFKGVKYTIDTSDLTGGLWFKYDSTQPENFSIPYFDKVVPGVSVTLPLAYIIPVQYTDIIARLPLHGIQLKSLHSGIKINATISRFSDPRWQPQPYEGHNRVTFKSTDTLVETEFPAGSVVVLMNQPSAQVIAHLLEPLSPNSFLSWGFFNPVFEQKEYFETYVMEPIAHDMLIKNPTLGKAFEKWKSENPKSAEDQYTQLAWFYSQTPWFDRQYNVYPVGRIFDKNTLLKIEASAHH